MVNLKYHNDERVDIVKIKYRDGTEETLLNQKCLEILKKKSLKIDSVQLLKSSRSIETVYPKEVCNKWIDLLKKTFSLNMKASYTITDEHHIIDLHYSAFDGIGQLYINLILLRYLWYNENNNLIYRIFDIREKTNYSVEESIILAHYYDDFLIRDFTFNLFSTVINTNRTIFNPLNEFSINIAYDNNHNKLMPKSCYTMMFTYLKLILTGDYKSDVDIIYKMWSNVSMYTNGYNTNITIMNINCLNYIFGLKLSISDSDDLKEGDILMNVTTIYQPLLIKFDKWYQDSSRMYIVGKTLSNGIVTVSRSYYKKILTNEN